MSILVTYFSVGGETKKVAQRVAKLTSGKLFEIKPVDPYKEEDMSRMNPFSRCNRERFGKKDVPVIGRFKDFDKYEKVVLVYPNWFGCTPNIIDTFCKDYDWTGKEVYLIATSGESKKGKTKKKLQPHIEGGEIVSGLQVQDMNSLSRWLRSVDLR